MVSQYLAHAKIQCDDALIANELQALEQYLTEQQGAQKAPWQYLVPELGEGGTCSLFGELSDTPFDLTHVLPNSAENQTALDTLQTIAEFVKSRTGVDWYGIYQTRELDEKALCKLAYFGAPSRPTFPVNPTFAQTSNNVQVVLSEQGRVINDVASYVAEGGEYYTCDPKVQAEVCLPLLGASGCVGIIDAESFQAGFFSEQHLATLIATCLVIPQYLPA